MRYTYEVYKTGTDQRVDTGVRVELVKLEKGQSIVITDNLSPNLKPVHIHNQDDLDGWVEAAARANQWMDKADREKIHSRALACGIDVDDDDLKKVDTADRTLAQHINPSYYQSYIQTELETLQWLEAMQYLPRYRNPESFCAAVELQIRKYMDRNGGKDSEVQEFMKALWYMKFLCAYMKNGHKPVRVVNVNTILDAKE